MLLYLILIIFCLIALIALSDWFSREARLMRKIPGPKAWPVVGNSLSLMIPPEKMALLIRKLPRLYGHVNQIHAMNIRVVNVSNPEDIEKILSSSQHTTKADFYRFASSWLGEGLPLSSGTKWQQRRKMLNKAFHFNVLKKFMIMFEEETEELLKQVDNETANERTDVVNILRPFVLRIILESTTGFSLRGDTVAYTRYFNSLLTLASCLILRFRKVWLHNDSLFKLSGIGRRQKLALEHFHALTNKVIKDKRELLDNTNFNSVDHNTVTSDKNKKLALLDILLQNEKSGLINNEGIQEEVNTFVFAGFDTTSVSLSFTLMALANEPAVQDKICEEQQRIFGDSQRSPTIEELSEMKYLECCIKESLRLYPSAPFIGRKLLEDVVLSGYTVPAGTTCVLLLFEVHRRADLFADPERFDPDRFLPDNCRDRHPYSYIPFSAGPRSCIGQKYAMLQMKTVLSGLFRKFRLEPVTRPSDLVFKPSLMLHTKHPMYVRFRLRN